MHASEIRKLFLDYFQRQSHVVRPSSSLVPVDDPTLLFTNAGMVQFKKIFLGQEVPTYGRRATTSQKCVRAGGKHNDLEQVGHTARHHTFFEMLGNFSFGDYFKRDAIRFAWEFVTVELDIDPSAVWVTVFREDEEARELWKSECGVDPARIFGLGERDNFWQMADTGPCGPCSEIYVDLARLTADWQFPAGATGEWTDVNRTEFSQDAFVEGAEAGRFLEIWNLVFMQFDRQVDGSFVPLPRPSVDTGAGLERIAAVKQGVMSNFHTDCFRSLIEEVSAVTGLVYEDAPSDWPNSAAAGGALKRSDRVDSAASFRVLADHARAVAFLLADGVFPSNEGRGYVLRRILRRASRHAWLLGRQHEPTLFHVVRKVLETMSDAYPELQQRSAHILETTRSEEERFLATISDGMLRFEQIAPAASTQGSTKVRGTISGEDAFRLYDTFGFPIDLTQLMARERGYTVDIPGFERALNSQRRQSQEERKSRGVVMSNDVLADPAGWERASHLSSGGGESSSSFVGYTELAVETELAALKRLDGGRVAVVLEQTPFYAESGGQISDRGLIEGDGFRVEVDEVRRFDGQIAAIGVLEGEVHFGRVQAFVPPVRRRDTERNHTATHLLHAALREELGDHVHQAGSLVEPERLRFDFTHHGPLTPEQIDRIEDRVNAVIAASIPVTQEVRSYPEAIAMGAMALFGEKYGDEVRVIGVDGVSLELCGGTHVRNTAEIGLFRLVSETGVAAGQRRIEALTGGGAFAHMRERERMLGRIADHLKAPLDVAEARVVALIGERRALEKRVDELRTSGGGDLAASIVGGARAVNGFRLVATVVDVPDMKELQLLGDQVREALGSGVGVLAAAPAGGKAALLVVVTDDLREKGLRADNLVRDLAATVGGKGGGKPHMAQAGLPDVASATAVVEAAENIVLAASSK